MVFVKNRGTRSEERFEITSVYSYDGNYCPCYVAEKYLTEWQLLKFKWFDDHTVYELVAPDNVHHIVVEWYL